MITQNVWKNIRSAICVILQRLRWRKRMMGWDGDAEEDLMYQYKMKCEYIYIKSTR
jgi:hypothetical protein